MRWMLFAVAALAVFTLLGFTALDSYDERTCVERRAVSGESRPHSLRRRVVVRCDGFLPW